MGINLPIVIVGAGGHARVLIDVLRTLGKKILGVIDPKLALGLAGPLGLPVLGGDDALDGYRTEEILLVNGIGSVGSLDVRQSIFNRFTERGFRFASVIHPSAVISQFAELSKGVQIMAGSIVQCGTLVGANSIVNTHASIDHDCKISESVHIAPGVTVCGSVCIGTGTHVGTGAVVIQGITIGRNCFVEAGAVVCSDLEDYQRSSRSTGARHGKRPRNTGDQDRNNQAGDRNA